ncbi:hypothetical protein HDU76_007967 [Blyttiomyces sp. JEL0837]|nr:hypothetical protein HDU76_007967 [Blyttiomyces sp. JEL0837]
MAAATMLSSSGGPMSSPGGRSARNLNLGGISGGDYITGGSADNTPSLRSSQNQNNQLPRSVGDMDPEKQLREGLEYVQEAFNRRTAHLSSEIAQWKTAASNQRQQIFALENENKGLHQRVAELERLTATQASELKALSHSKSALQEKYAILKKNAAQLESFRRNIVSMVESGPITDIGVLSKHQSFFDADDSIHNQISSMNMNMNMDNDGPSINLGMMPNPSLSGGHGSHQQQQQQQQHRSSMPNSGSTRGNSFGEGLLDGNSSFFDEKNLHSLDISGQSLDYSLAIHPSDKQYSSKPNIQSPSRRSNGAGSMRQSSGSSYQDRNDQVSWRDSPPKSRRDGNRDSPIGKIDTRMASSIGKASLSTPNLSAEKDRRSPVNADPPSKQQQQPQSQSTTTNVAASSSTSVAPSASASASNQNQNQNPATPIDAPTLYKQIRDTLTASEFEEFAANVAAFNATDQDAEATVRNIGRLVKDRGLFLQMRNLIYTALEESAKGGSGGK